MSGRILDHSNMEIQMRQTYENAKKLLDRFRAASTVLVTPRLALPTQLIEIKFIARV
jgi:hypothetical protein